MAENNQWYPFYTGDYARDTAHLSLLEHGAYRLLLDHYYATGSALPNDPEKLYRICRARTPNERKSVLSAVNEFFHQDGTLLRSTRCDREIAKRLNISKTRSANAMQKQSKGSANGSTKDSTKEVLD
ncbi:YdaU family protein [Limnoglobus roseus]|uniref:YdaU family protein n=1 Tax=Limnoglobus roseus TaxID=2598579 RepID=UPI0011EA728B|nr:YdaU family protein [Limnoglobus roseus]